MSRGSIIVAVFGLVPLLKSPQVSGAEKTVTEEIPLRYAGAPEVLMRFVAVTPGVGGGIPTSTNVATLGVDLVWSPGSLRPASKSPFALPEGVTELRTDFSKNALRVEGTAEAVKKFRNLVTILDLPHIAISVNFTVMELSREAAKSLGARPRYGGVIAIPEQQLGALLKSAANSPEVKVVGKAGVSTFSNCPASLVVQADTQEVPVGEGVPTVPGIAMFEGAVMHVIPTSHQDGTIGLALQYSVTRPWEATSKDATKSPRNLSFTQSRTMSLHTNAPDGKVAGFLLPEGFDPARPDKVIAISVQAKRE